MTRHVFQPFPEDNKGNALPGVAFQVFPWSLGQTFVSQAADNTWSFVAANAPAASTVFVSPDPAVATALTPAQLTSDANGVIKEAYLDDGAYVVVATVGTRVFVNPKYEVGDMSATQLASLDTRLVAVEAREDAGQIIGSAATLAALEALRDANPDASEGDRYFLTAVDGANVAGEYTQDAADNIILRLANAAPPSEVLDGAGAPTGTVPSGAKLYIDTSTGTEYIPDPANPTAWILKPTPPAAVDNDSMTFSI